MQCVMEALFTEIAKAEPDTRRLKSMHQHLVLLRLRPEHVLMAFFLVGLAHTVAQVAQSWVKLKFVWIFFKFGIGKNYRVVRDLFDLIFGMKNSEISSFDSTIATFDDWKGCWTRSFMMNPTNKSWNIKFQSCETNVSYNCRFVKVSGIRQDIFNLAIALCLQ